MISCALLLSATHVAHAQTRDSTHVLVRGVVLDANTGRAIANAQISAIGSLAAARTDSAGQFVFGAPVAGAALVHVRRLGYAPHLFTVRLDDATTRQFVFELEPYVPTLDTVTVSAVNRVARTRLDVFAMRRSTSIGGHFISGDDILRRGLPFTSSAMHAVPGAYVRWDEYGRVKLLNTRGACAFRMGLDGVLVDDFDIDQFHPNEIHGIEIYAGPASVPAEYLGSHRITCGLIMVWTR